MCNMNLPLNRGLQTYWLSASESDTKPVITLANGVMVFPAFITTETREETDPETQEKKTKTVYKYFPVDMTWKGDDLNDYVKVMRCRWEELREHFYGPAWAQAEMEAKGIWTLHAMAVRAVFPKAEGEVPEALRNFWEAWTNFWTLISQASQKYGIPYAEIPSYFDSTYLLTIATQYQIPQDELSILITKMQLIQFDVLANKFVWKNLFPKPEQQILVDLLG